MRREELKKKEAINAKVKDALEARRIANEQGDESADTELELLKGYYAQHCGSSSRKFSDKHNFVNCKCRLLLPPVPSHFFL